MDDTPRNPVELVEEHASLSKKRVETGHVRVHVRTESEAVNAQASLFDQHVDVTRVPIGRELTEAPAVRTEGDTTIFPVLEEILVVEKRLFLIEEVHVRRVVTRTEASQPVTVRRQWADIERNDNPTKEMK